MKINKAMRSDAEGSDGGQRNCGSLEDMSPATASDRQSAGRSEGRLIRGSIPKRVVELTNHVQGLAVWQVDKVRHVESTLLPTAATVPNMRSFHCDCFPPI
jgi:hypothetical protein